VLTLVTAALLLHLQADVDLQPNPEEVAAVKHVDLQELQAEWTQLANSCDCIAVEIAGGCRFAAKP
jgi:isopentenyldiphosphate isomerase